MAHKFNEIYTGNNLDMISFPLGGIGSGMLCLDGNGGISKVSLRHRPDMFNHPLIFSALSIKHNNTRIARILQGQTPGWKILFPWKAENSGNGSSGKTFGFPFFRDCGFEAKFPFANIDLTDADIPVSVRLTAWSPFVPGNADESSLPVAALEYTITNTTEDKIEAVFYHAAENFMAQRGAEVCCGDNKPVEPDDHVFNISNGYVLQQPGTDHRAGTLAVICGEDAKINCRWFRGGWFDPVSSLWREIENGDMPENEPVNDDAGPSKGGSLSTAFVLEADESKTIKILMAWHVPYSDLSIGLPEDRADQRYSPWYATKFGNIEDIIQHWQDNYDMLRKASQTFSDKLYSVSVPPEAIEAVAANLTILKSPTVLRQSDGRLWAWEGCCDQRGCCSGSCTHVWNYAQALPHLFADMERSLRLTEFYDCQDESGHQNFRASLPIGQVGHDSHAAADGQLGGIMKIHRDWKISGDTNWLRAMWPQVSRSLDYCIETWDPQHNGYLVEPHHNTYDIEFWGADGMCTSFYLGALKAACIISEALGEDAGIYTCLLEKGRLYMETELFNGEYFIQNTVWTGLRSPSPENSPSHLFNNAYKSSEALNLLKKEWPKYQYGSGCLSDGVLGAWMAKVCEIGDILDADKVKSHLLSVYRYNFRRSLHDHANPQRPTYALNDEAGLLLCTWPNGNRPTLPFPYSDEVWTGIEYQVASHLIMCGEDEKGLEIVRAVRKRYDGTVRNPFNEYECGHWYARAMSSFALLQAYGEEIS